ncbi:IS110 family RNA-guided transposase [Acidiluteibacter ferrifornacis]|uniref:IS110 family transposase n=1 Tax=Acidiluteibacter ferrifornacis TaxID=2692424 RepID=A0A6N9NQA6_9FLAO|nr:IS110 family transposase [Acidiluteibacter ferrifornacis]NBG67461.1 IS110 family transposase [Acidiluteibacter ferrifornacis]
MNKDIKYYGIDISKDVFDVCDSTGESSQYENNVKGFKQFVKTLSVNSHCVMEATGYYHYQLAYYLLESAVKVSVENPLSIKRFIQMKLSKVKTDKSDAKMICEYAQKVEMRLWEGHSKNQVECLQISRLLDLYFKQSTAVKNKIHGENVLGKPSSLVMKSLQQSKRNIEKLIKELEARLTELVKSEHQELLTLLESIPGMGRKTSMMLIVLTDGFNRFDNAKQLCCYSGLTPTIRQSGSSVRGKSRISKVGNRKLRNLLFMCSFTACKHNKSCKQMYDRIVAKGKSKKLALIAICNKLLKQAFAIAKSGIPFDQSYRSKLGI